MNVIALIPAKGNSRRLPNKNLLPCAGVPLVTRAIRCAKDAGIFSQIVVSTDSPEIAAIAKEEGDIRVLWRPAILCADGVEWAAVVSHFLATWNYHMDAFAVLPPTTPTRTAFQLRARFKEFVQQGNHGYLATLNFRGQCDGDTVFCTPERFLKLLQFPWSDAAGAYIQLEQAVDINTAEDLARAEAMLKLWPVEEIIDRNYKKLGVDPI
jgi:CMP-N-acetylneuraminic acid synthetase